MVRLGGPGADGGGWALLPAAGASNPRSLSEPVARGGDAGYWAGRAAPRGPQGPVLADASGPTPLPPPPAFHDPHGLPRDMPGAHSPAALALSQSPCPETGPFPRLSERWVFGALRAVVPSPSRRGTRQTRLHGGLVGK